MVCQDLIYSNDYADYIIDTTSIRGRELSGNAVCSQQINQEYAVIQVPREEKEEEMRDFLNYQNIPRLFGLLELSHLEETGVTQLQRNPNFDLLGQNVVLGVIDTGIDYTNEAFIDANGESRILAI